MKSGMRRLVVLVGLGVFALCGSAQALTFSVSDINFSALTGNSDNPGFEWSLSSEPGFSFNLDVGDSYTFTYGYFTTDVFPVNKHEAADNDDSFTASFNVTPPTPTTPTSRIGIPDAAEVIASDKGVAWIEFDNSWIEKSFKDGGLYRLMFLDVPLFSVDGTYNLQATLEYLRGPSTVVVDQDTPAPVPEPSTVVLLGSGLLGLLYMGRKKIR